MISASANTVMMWDGKPILLDRFLGRLPSRPDLDECWIWPQSAAPRRYGVQTNVSRILAGRRDHYLTQE